MNTVQYDANLDEKASRIELFIRIVWFVIGSIILNGSGIFFFLATIVQWLHILILGKRNGMLANFGGLYMNYFSQVLSYGFLVTENRFPLIPKANGTAGVTYNVTSAEKASRLELFIRFFWSIPAVIVLVVMEIISYIIIPITWLLILILGKRNLALAAYIKLYIKYSAQWQTYFYLLTDERNPILPQ